MDLLTYLNDIGQRAKTTAPLLARLSSTDKNNLLARMADYLIAHQDEIINANQEDLVNATAKGLSAPLIDRLTINQPRIIAMAEGLRVLIGLEDPVGRVISMWKRPNGLEIGQQRVPLGVVGIIYEARPNVTIDVAGLCLKTGNAVVLKRRFGGA